MIQESGAVLRNHRFRPAFFSLTLNLPRIAAAARPGQFLHLLVPDVPDVLLRRPFSIASVNKPQVELLIHIIGTGTRAISQLPESCICDVLGPLGRPFDLDSSSQALLIGGGIGVAPLLFFHDELTRAGAETRFFLGAKSRDEYPLTDEMINQHKIIVCTDDGSFGASGFVSTIFEKWLVENPGSQYRAYSCGPAVMMRAIDRICEEYGIRHQVSLENRMACGIGICQGCATPTKSGFKLVCKDGPVFDANDIDWSRLP